MSDTTPDGRIIWPSVPEAYWPHPSKPWRVIWGIGAFEDFATEAEAKTFHADLLSRNKNGWEKLVQDPKNVVEA